MSGEVLALPYECWRWIPGFEGWYQVSTRGRVRSVDRWVIRKDGRKRLIKGQILKPTRGDVGYLTVKLWRDGKGHTFRVHRMVAETWLDNPENKPEVNHRDEDKTNNDVFNLSYCSRIENANWGTGIERMTASKSKAVQAIDPKTGKVVKEFPSTKEAERNGFNSGHVSNCCLGRYGYRTHRGFIWRYKES